MVNKCNLGGYFGFFPHTKKDKILPVMTVWLPVTLAGGYLTVRFIDCQNLYVLLKYTIHISSEITGGYLTAKFFDFGILFSKFGFVFQNLENR